MDHRPFTSSILMVNLSTSWGGGEKWFFTVGKALKAKGYTVTWCVYTGSELESRLKKENLDFISIRAKTTTLLNPFKLFSIRNRIQQLKPDIVMLNGSHELKVIGLTAKWAGVPNIIFRRGVSYPIRPTVINKWYIRKVATAFLANANATFEAFAGAFPVVRQKPHLTLNNAIDLSQWEDFSEKKVPHRIGMSARLSSEKGIDRAMEAMAMLKEAGTPFEFMIMGSGPERDNLSTLSRELGIEKQVEFAGFVENVRERLSTCSIFLFTPRFGEGTSIALIEAMATGLPCVAFDTPSMKEVILQGETGFLAPDGDITQLAAYISTLLSDPERMARMGQNGQKRAREFFELEGLVKKLSVWLENINQPA